MTYEGIVQGSPEWGAIRAGKLSASRIGDALATVKNGWGASRATLVGELVAQRLTGEVPEGFTNEAMRWGTEKEGEARTAYEFDRRVSVVEIAYVDHPTIKMSGCSPDGLVNDDGLVEIKCPNTATHIETLLSGKAPSKYLLQMQWQMACTGRRWCDFVSFDPRMPADMQLFVTRVDRPSDEFMADLEAKAREFLAEVDAKVSALTAKFRTKAT